MTDTRLRTWIRVDGAASVLAGILGFELAGRIAERLDVTATGVRAVAVLFLLCGLESLLVAAAPDRLLAPATRLLAIGQEAAFVLALLVGLRDGIGRADAVLAAVTAGVAVVAWLELRAVRPAATAPSIPADGWVPGGSAIPR